MSSRHLTHTQLACLVEAIDGPGAAFSSLLHLKECRRCRSRLVTDFPGGGPELVHEYNLGGQRGGRSLSAFPEDLTASWIDASSKLDAEIFEAPALSRDLEHIDPARQGLALEARRFHTLGFAVRLLSESASLWHENPPEACRLSRLAVTVVSKLDPAAYPLGLTADLRSKALAYLGNALRLVGKLGEAERRLTEALGGLGSGTGDPNLRARVLTLLAQLHKAQRLFPEALRKAREARRIYQEEGALREMALLDLIHAAILGESGDTGRAIQALRSLLSSLPKAVMGEAVYWAARQNLAHRLVDDERLWEARSELREVKRWAHQTGASLIAARVRWVEALLTGSEGDTRGAALRLERVRNEFVSHGLPYDAALACLDLAAVHLRRGDAEAARDLAGVLAPVFGATGIHREALASLRLLVSALEEKSATAAQVEALHEHLTRQRWREIHD